MKQHLKADQPVGTIFKERLPFLAFLDIYTDGWFIEYAIDHESVEDKSTLNWKRYHNNPIQEHGELSHVTVYGLSNPFDSDENVVYRFNGGTQGATGYIKTIGVYIQS